MKKPPAKKPTVKKQAGEKIKPANDPHSDEKIKLLSELSALTADINENGLKFLIRQAEVLLYNMKVEQVNAEIQKLTVEKRKRRKLPQIRIRKIINGYNRIGQRRFIYFCDKQDPQILHAR